MEFTMKLTQRDQKLIILLAVILILAGFGFFAVIPAMEEKSALEAEIQIARQEQDVLEQKVMMYQSHKAVLERLETEYKEASADYYPLLENQVLERMITKWISSYDLQILQQTVHVPEETKEIEPFYNAVMIPSGSTDGIYIGTDTVRVTGSRDQLMKLVYSFTGTDPAIRVVSFDMTQKNTEGATVLQMVLEVYMCRK